MGLEKLQPDLLICDFVSAFGAHAADELGIPVIIHAPSPLSIANFISREWSPNDGNLWDCWGCLCQKMTLIDFFMEYQAVNWISRKYRDHFMSIKDRAVICISFLGLDKPCLMPPNIHLTGPLMRDSQ